MSNIFSITDIDDKFKSLNIFNIKIAIKKQYYKLFFKHKIRENSITIEELEKTLKALSDNMIEKLEGIFDYRLTKQNRKRIHYFLARITDYIEEESGISSRIDSYLNKGNGKDFEIEHIIANNFLEYSNYFENEEEFQFVRNSIGNLALLQRGQNQSLGNKKFKDKKLRYKGENLLLQSLCEEAYVSNPNFIKFLKAQEIDLKSVENFAKAEVKDRTKLYYILAKKIWKI